MRRLVGRQGCSGTGEIQSAVGALMSVGTESGEQCEVIAAFMARYLIRGALAHLMKISHWVARTPYHFEHHPEFFFVKAFSRP